MSTREQRNQELYDDESWKTVCFLGLDGSGKSSIVWSLRGENELENRPRTFGVNMLSIDGLNLNIIDCSGLRVFRKVLWPQVIRLSDLVVFVIDASAREKVEEAREALDIIYDYLGYRPILFLSSKNDKVNTMSPETIIKKLKLKDLKNRWLLTPVSVVKKINLRLMEFVLKYATFKAATSMFTQPEDREVYFLKPFIFN
ncbi:MAG: ADP-ribosylation factor-like protein [Candidatus Hodarchaeota archaeon]